MPTCMVTLVGYEDEIWNAWKIIFFANIVRRGRHPSILGWLPRRVTRSSDENLPTKGRRFSYWMMSNVFVLKKSWHSIFLLIIILSKRDVDRSSDKKNYSILSAFFSARWKNFSALPTLLVSCYVKCHGAFTCSVFLRILFLLAPQDIVFPRVTRNSRLGRLTFSKTEETLPREKHSEDGRIVSLCAWVKCRFWMFF